MPEIIIYYCDTCGFKPHDNITHRQYVTDDNGCRIPCYHPSEQLKIRQVLGPDITEEKYRERTGVWYGSTCLDCLAGFNLDYSRDEQRCPVCSSERISRTYLLKGLVCPKCGKGIIQSKDSGVVV